MLLLQSYDTEHDNSELLEQMSDAVDLLVPVSKNGNVARAMDDDEEGEAVEPIAVLADLMVNLLQRPSVFLRTVVERVFAGFSGDVSEQALQLLLDQITADTGDVLSEDEAEDSEAEDEEDSDAGDASKVNGKQAGKTVADSDSDDDSDDEDSDEELDIDLDADPELKAKVEAALRGAGLVNGEADDNEDESDEEEEEEEEEILDDDQMMQLDEQLAEIFRAKKAGNKGAKADQEASLNARLKVLDLLEVYAKQQAGNPLLLQVVRPLLRIANKSDNEETDFAAKAARVLRGIVVKPKDYPTPSDVSSLLPILTAVHSLAQRSNSPEILSLASSASLYIARIVLASADNQHQQAIIDAYISSWSDYLVRKRSRLQPKFFVDFITRFREHSWALREAVLEACSQTTVTKEKFKRCQAFHVLAELVAAQCSLVSCKHPLLRP